MDQQESSQKSPTVISPPTSPTNADNNETSSNPRHSRRGTVFGLSKIVRGLNKSSSSSSNSKSNTNNSPQNKSSNSGDSSTTNTLNNNNNTNNNNRTSIPITTRTNRNSRGNSLTSSSTDGASANTKRSCRETSFHSRMQQRKASVRIVNAEALQEHIAHQLLSSDN